MGLHLESFSGHKATWSKEEASKALEPRAGSLLLKGGLDGSGHALSGTWFWSQLLGFSSGPNSRLLGWGGASPDSSSGCMPGCRLWLCPGSCAILGDESVNRTSSSPFFLSLFSHFTFLIR